MAPIPAEALRGTDGDSGPEDLVYTIEQPSNGRVVLWAAPGTEVRSFTQAQLDGGLVLFSHRGPGPGFLLPLGSPEVGSQLGPADPMPPSPGALDGGFHFGLSDGEHTSSGHFFRVTAQKQVLLSLEGSQTLTVCPGACVDRGHSWLLGAREEPLSSQSLRASSSAGADPQLLLYRVVQGPQLGRLFHAQQDSVGEALVNFTQAEVRAPLCSHHSDASSLKWPLCHGHHVDTSSSVAGSRHGDAVGGEAATGPVGRGVSLGLRFRCQPEAEWILGADELMEGN
ncbi:Chondroitin sulfate proteoglycan 4 [Saguinus oedipus]|uniref:Chondroitin sulfate proteoglycan 4 n=1 Tax=Saguinus oedipus TaxID=9490 RepID=A0ABQ9V214_SAGOE|nr:Chondroitin sulfate proteoglycan 4 [Saguinus oedipus]